MFFEEALQRGVSFFLCSQNKFSFCDYIYLFSLRVCHLKPMFFLRVKEILKHNLDWRHFTCLIQLNLEPKSC